jgi:uncharacterized protein (TIGR02597 family)
MKTFAVLHLALAALPAGAAVVSAPVGYMRYHFPGHATEALAVPLLRPVVYAGMIESATGATLTLATCGDAPDCTAMLAAEAAYYLEITDAADCAGERLDIDVAATRANPAGSLVIAVDSPHNTVSGDLACLAGQPLVIRPHWTLASLFGASAEAGELHSATTAAAADQVWFWGGQLVEVYWFRQNSAGDIRHWARLGSTADADQTVIAPGTGVFFKRASHTDLWLTVTGEVRTNRFVLPLPHATSLLAPGFPLAASPYASGLTAASGLTPAPTAAAADQLWLWDGYKVNVFWYRCNSACTALRWHNTLTGTIDYTLAPIIDPFAAFFLRIQDPDPGRLTIAPPY